MKSLKFDKIIITNLPAFYKVNLFNEIAKSEDIYVVFTGNTAEIRNTDFFKKELIRFDFIELKNKSTLSRFVFIVKLLLLSKYNELILGGWDEPLLLLSSIISCKRKNSVIVESSIYESKVNGFKGAIKKMFLSRISKVYASGKAQISLLQALDFKGIINKTKGVGIFNIRHQPKYEERATVSNFLYVGRLSKEKNLDKLIKDFAEFPNLTLNIVGFGPEESRLKSIASENVIFHGAINNSELHKFYRDYDVLVLPSLSETWGLVVEEALNNGMPVIVSNRVGCADEIINLNENGLIFNIDEDKSLRYAIAGITDIVFYNNLRKNISNMDFQIIAQNQVKVYLHHN